mmetsp:Transcript_580/g.1161  ORF Transcript_580/g.1161 Transcript_580/m.1161 type:complete len:202 (+) Transcript_580:780-1385(+)
MAYIQNLLYKTSHKEEPGLLSCESPGSNVKDLLLLKIRYSCSMRALHVICINFQRRNRVHLNHGIPRQGYLLVSTSEKSTTSRWGIALVRTVARLDSKSERQSCSDSVPFPLLVTMTLPLKMVRERSVAMFFWSWFEVQWGDEWMMSDVRSTILLSLLRPKPRTSPCEPVSTRSTEAVVRENCPPAPTESREAVESLPASS